MFFTFRKVIEQIHICIKHHEINEHMYREPTRSGGRSTTSLTKDELLDMILDHLGLEVQMEDRVRVACLVPKAKKGEESPTGTKMFYNSSGVESERL
jgi:hypothetical protein